jgi:regulatory protein
MHGRITALEPDPRRPTSVRIEVEGDLVFTVPAETITGERLTTGLVVDEALHERLTRAADAEAAYRSMLRSLELRSFARGDLARRLVRKGHPREAVDAALERVEHLGLLDDAAFARNYVQTRAPRGRGPARLVRDLLSMGVARQLIDQAIAAEWPEGSDRTSAPLALATRRAAQLGALPAPAKRRRLLAYLARRGFSGHEVTRIVSDVVKESS